MYVHIGAIMPTHICPRISVIMPASSWMAPSVFEETMCVCVCAALVFYATHVPTLKVWTFAAVMMSSALEPCISKALPDDVANHFTTAAG